MGLCDVFFPGQFPTRLCSFIVTSEGVRRTVLLNITQPGMIAFGERVRVVSLISDGDPTEIITASDNRLQHPKFGYPKPGWVQVTLTGLNYSSQNPNLPKAKSYLPTQNHCTCRPKAVSPYSLIISWELLRTLDSLALHERCNSGHLYNNPLGRPYCPHARQTG